MGQTDAKGNPLPLSRELLEAGAFEAAYRGEAPSLRLLTDDERRSSLEAVLALRPVGDLWLFAYGSLIWNPTVRSVEQRIARIDGWHRAFCLTAVAGRGSPEHPGLTLALDEGGSCEGVAYRISEHDVESELTLLWRREMVSGAYVPRWIGLREKSGDPLGSALAFTVDPTGPHYSGNLSAEALIRILATARGSLGSCAEYLVRTRDALRALGIPDSELEELGEKVEEAQGRLNGSAPYPAQ